MANPNDPAIIRMVQALRQAGFTGQSLITMTSLGICESGGDPNALNDNPRTGDYSVGAFQINYYNGLRASRTAQFGPPEALRGDLQAQANAAFKLSGGGQTFNPWQGDYSNGKYYANLPVATAAVNAVMGGATAPGAPGTPSVDSGTNANTATNTSAPDSGCLISFPGIPLPSLGPIGGGSIGGGCIMSRDQGRHILGGLCILAGCLIGALGIVMVVKDDINPMSTAQSMVGKVRESQQNKRDEALEKMAPDPKDQAYKKRLEEKRRTYDAKTGKNYMGQTPEEVDADTF